MIVSASPPIAGSMLMSLGQARSFVAPFSHTGEARFEGLPMDLIFNPTEPDLDFAVLGA